MMMRRAHEVGAAARRVPAGTLFVAIILAALATTLFYSDWVVGEPTGATMQSNSTDYGPTFNPASHTANRSTITTIALDVLQQDQFWKAYVGNVTGTFTLDDADNYTIYSWPSGAAVTGEVIASRNQSANFAGLTCADAATINAEETFHNMTGTESDSIGATFNSTVHADTIISGITLEDCNSTALYVNDTQQDQSDTASFQEILAEDGSNNLLYVARINDDEDSYNNNTMDFQMIVAESNVKSTPTTYYFWVELG